MKSHKYFVLFFVVFFSVMGGYLLSYANFSKGLPENLVGKNEAYARQGDSLAARPEFAQLQEVFRAVPAKVLPSVVQINVSSVTQAPMLQNPFFRFFGQPDDDAPKQEYRRTGLGSGSIIKKEGRSYYVLTNNHVVKNAEDIQVVTHDEQNFPAEIVGSDSRVDLALVKFTTPRLLETISIAELGNSSELKIGDMVMAIGSPDGFQSTVTQGIVSYVGRRGGPGGNINDFIQTDASINRGNSGGPLVNMDGQVIGINTWIASESGSSAGLGFAIPIDNAKFVIDSFLKDGKLRYGWLGVGIPNYQGMVEQLGSEAAKEVLGPLGIYGKKGAFISDVYSNSPAGNAGILPGDYVIALNGQPIQSSEELTFEVGMLRPKEVVRLTLIREGEQKQIRVTLGERQPEEQLAQDKALKTLGSGWPGVSVIPISGKTGEQLRKMSNGRIDTEEDSGLLVISVRPDSAIQLVGIQNGDVITQINDKKVEDLAQFYRELNKNPVGNTVFTYKRKGYELETPKIRLKK